MNLSKFLSDQEAVEVNHYRPRQRSLKLLGVIALFIIAPTISYFIGQALGNINHKENLVFQEELLAASKTLEQKLRSNENQKNHAEATVSVQKQTIESLRQEILQWQIKYQELDENMKLYRSVMKIGSDESTINVETVTIDQTNSPVNGNSQLYSYRLNMNIVQRSLKRQRFDGNLKVTINGINGQNQEIELQNDELFDQDSIALGFKYVQKLEKEFYLPSNFTPRSISFVINGRSLNRPIQNEVQWAEISSNSNGLNCQPPLQQTGKQLRLSKDLSSNS